MFRRNSGCSAGPENSRNSVPNHSAEEKKSRNSVPWNKNRSKLSKFLNHSPEEKLTQNSVMWNKIRSKFSVFRSEACLGQKHAVNFVCWSRIFCKPIFFMSFRSVPNFEIDSSVKRMPRNDHFLPRNNGNHFESVLRNFFGTKFRCQPLMCATRPRSYNRVINTKTGNADTEWKNWFIASIAYSINDEDKL